MKPKDTLQLDNILKEKKAREIEEKRLFDEEQKRIKQDIENKKNLLDLMQVKLHVRLQ